MSDQGCCSITLGTEFDRIEKQTVEFNELISTLEGRLDYLMTPTTGAHGDKTTPPPEQIVSSPAINKTADILCGQAVLMSRIKAIMARLQV